MRKIIIFVLCLFVFLAIPSSILAKNNPTANPNNKFGIHVMDERDFIDATTLINSSGGDWGYVTFVITEQDRNRDRWQKVFDEARKSHLIPIVRIASKANGANWEIPKNEEIDGWIAFLNSLNWVIQNRYVIIGNEPNHAKEWGGSIDPATYATYLNSFSKKLHETSDDFYVLPAGLDASARNTAETMDEITFIRRMLIAQPNVFENIDGWTSHSYPNPDFSGKETDKGRGTIQTFDWELNFLSTLGVTKNLPVFITETGWSNEKIEPNKISEMYMYAFENVWNDPRVVAVTPFILNYTESPFSQFTWKKKDGSFFPYFESYKNITKIKGVPIQIESGQIIGALAQPIMFENSDFVGAILAKNTGQSIWNTDNLKIVSDDGSIVFKNSLLFDIEPVRTGLIIFKASPLKNKGILLKSIYLANENNKRITNSFPIEAFIAKANKMQFQTFFVKIGSSLREIIGPMAQR
jgi:hypothetical protein